LIVSEDAMGAHKNKVHVDCPISSGIKAVSAAPCLP